MVIPGRVQNGVVILDGPAPPEGAAVTVSYDAALVIQFAKHSQRVVLPLFDSDQPGTLDVTNEQIAEVLDREDASS